VQTNRAALSAYNAAIFGASVDRVDTNRRFADALGAEFPMLCDVDRRVARAYGVLGASGFPSRWTFYIGEDGRILRIDTAVRVASAGIDIAKTLEVLGISRRV
jgi:peroxiredoxin Q/BCP